MFNSLTLSTYELKMDVFRYAMILTTSGITFIYKMTRHLVILFSLLLILARVSDTAVAQSRATVMYNFNIGSLSSPTNFFHYNVRPGANIAVTTNADGSITISGAAGGGGTNTLVLTNGVEVGSGGKFNFIDATGMLSGAVVTIGGFSSSAGKMSVLGGTNVLFFNETNMLAPGATIAQWKLQDTNGNTYFHFRTNLVMFYGTNSQGLWISNSAIPGIVSFGVSNSVPLITFNGANNNITFGGDMFGNGSGLTNLPNINNVRFQPSDAVLTNLVGTVLRNITNFVSLSTTNATSKPLSNSYTAGVLTLFGLEAGANVTLTMNGSNIVIASTGGSGGSVVTNSFQFGVTADGTLTLKDGLLITNPIVQTTLTILNTNQAGFSNFLAGYPLTLTNSFEGPTNTVQSAFIRFAVNAFQTGTGATNAVQFAEMGYVPTINAVGTTNGNWVFVTRPTRNGVPTTNMVLSSAGAVTFSGTVSATTSISVSGGASMTGSRVIAGASSFLEISGKSKFASSTDGDMTVENQAATSFVKFQLGGTTAAFPAVGRTNGDMFVFGADGTFAGTTNRLVAERFAVGNTASATMTNMLTGSATLDFASQTVGSFEDLPITVTGAADGDFTTVAPPVASTTGIVGTFTSYASNNTVYVRFVSTGTTQNPASGTFKVLVKKFL
jgi:hypothetical protein